MTGGRSLTAWALIVSVVALVLPWPPTVALADGAQVSPSFTTFSNPNEILDLAIDADDGSVWIATAAGVQRLVP